MARYLRVDVEGPVVGSGRIVYTALDGATDYTDKDLEEIAQDVVNSVYSWGHSVVDESEVPENDR